MIKKFSVTNYRNFNKKICIDFSNIREYEFNSYCVNNGLLNKVMIFGNNGCGKTNLGYALFDIVGTLTDKWITRACKDDVLFLNADSSEKFATFEYEFILDGRNIKYTYKKKQYEKLLEESLYVDDCFIFSYNSESGFDSKSNLELIGAETLNFEYFEKGFSVLRYIANNSNVNRIPVITSLIRFVNSMLLFRSLDKNQFVGLKAGAGENMQDYIIDNNLVEEFREFLLKTAKLDYQFEIYQDEIFDTKTLLEVHNKRKIDFSQAASTGTKALMTFFYWKEHLKNVTFLWVDEFDAFYHFELSRSIIREIIPYLNMQTIFTSHNTYLITNRLLRPDSYLKLEDGEIDSFSDLTFRELREGHNLEKLYRNGEFDKNEE